MRKGRVNVPKAVELREAPALGFLDIRGNPEDSAFQSATTSILNVTLPTSPRQCARAETTVAYWLGPTEWLLAVAKGTEQECEAQLRQSLAHGFAITDVSSGHAQFELIGKKAEEVLRKSTPYDFHPTVFPPNSCVQTIFAKTNALIAHHPDNSWELIVRPSYADYVKRWVTAATAEYV